MTQSVRECDSKRLFYRKYLYNIRVNTPLAYAFRDGKTGKNRLDGIQAVINHANDAYDRAAKKQKNLHKATRIELKDNFFRYRSRDISEVDIKDARKLLKILKENEGYHIRVEGNKVAIFTNDETLAPKIFSKLKGSGHEYQRPSDEYKEFLTQNVDVIIVNKEPELEYRVTMNGKRTNIEALIAWLEANPDKSGVTPNTLTYMRTRTWADGYYFYIRDAKVLTLITMLAGNCIRRVDKLVYAGDIDK